MTQHVHSVTVEVWPKIRAGKESFVIRAYPVELPCPPGGLLPDPPLHIVNRPGGRGGDSVMTCFCIPGTLLAERVDREQVGAYLDAHAHEIVGEVVWRTIANEPAPRHAPIMVDKVCLNGVDAIEDIGPLCTKSMSFNDVCLHSVVILSGGQHFKANWVSSKFILRAVAEGLTVTRSSLSWTNPHCSLKKCPVALTATPLKQRLR